MLKLLKYEWKACARICLPLYAVELLVAFINRLLYSDIGSKLLYGIPSIVMTMLYAAIMVALFVVTAVVLVQRFYKNLLGSGAKEDNRLSGTHPRPTDTPRKPDNNDLTQKHFPPQIFRPAPSGRALSCAANHAIAAATAHRKRRAQR